MTIRFGNTTISGVPRDRYAWYRAFYWRWYGLKVRVVR